MAGKDGERVDRGGPDAGGPGRNLVPLDRRVRTSWWLEAAAAAAVVTALAVAGAAISDVTSVPTALLAVGLPAAIAAGLLPVLRYRRWRYALRADALWLRFGVLRVTVSVIPFNRLQFVDTRQGPLDRMLGLARLVVHTAAVGTSGVLPGLDAADAAALRDRLAVAQRDTDG